MAEILPGGVSVPTFNQFKGGIDRAPYLYPNDIGVNWQDIGSFTAGIIYTTVYLGNGVAIAGMSGSGYLFRSTDYGASWATLGAISGASIINSAYLGNEMVYIYLQCF